MTTTIEVGEAIHIARSGRLILKISSGVVLKSGENLFDKTGKRVGRVTELIGPVAAPYASVLLDNIQSRKIIGSTLFRLSVQKDMPHTNRMKDRHSRNKKRR